MSSYGFMVYSALTNTATLTWGNQGTVAGFFKHLLRQEYGTFSLAKGGRETASFSKAIVTHVCLYIACSFLALLFVCVIFFLNVLMVLCVHGKLLLIRMIAFLLPPSRGALARSYAHEHGRADRVPILPAAVGWERGVPLHHRSHHSLLRHSTSLVRSH
jgi:hypothetical protein